MNHDEFMRRAVAISSLGGVETRKQDRVESLGRAYLTKTHKMDGSRRQ
jgi:hypothetical protein